MSIDFVYKYVTTTVQGTVGFVGFHLLRLEYMTSDRVLPGAVVKSEQHFFFFFFF